MLIFGQKWPFFLPKRAKRDFSGKIRKCHFRRIRKPQLCAKNKKILMSRFWNFCRTDERTDERKLNHKSQPRCGGTKKGSKTGQKFWCQNFKLIFSISNIRDIFTKKWKIGQKFIVKTRLFSWRNMAKSFCLLHKDPYGLIHYRRIWP